jgi:formylglycine-generating enzyme required for sulfatase activity
MFHKVEDFWVGKYPVTNNQYQRFINSPDYLERELWIDFPMYDEEGNQMKDNWGNKGFEWIEWQDNYLPNIRMEKTHKMLPKHWDDPRLGILRRHAPVIGISWYEANAYCKWITRHWDELEESKNSPPYPFIARLPTTKEWEKAAGGDVPRDRYAWDKPGNATKSLGEILNNSNVRESKLSSTTQVWLYPTGGSPSGVMDMSGNIWEWQANFSHREHDYLALRGGSWNVNKELAQIGYKFYFHPFDRSSSVGFRLIITPK